MKKSNLLYMILGIGIGITVCSIALMIKPSVEVREYTSDEIKEAAIEMGFGDMKDLIEANTKLKKDLEDTHKEFNKSKDEVSKLKNTLETINNEFEELRTLVKTNEDGKVKIENKKSETVISDSGSVMIVVDKGDTSQEVTSKLFDKGLISNKEDFLDTFYKLKATRKIQYGKFNIDKNLGYEKIIEIITTNL